MAQVLGRKVDLATPDALHPVYSVAQHSINCYLEAKSRSCSKRVQLGCLLHDASESYISDITRPVIIIPYVG